MSELVSIIIPVFNSEQFIDEAMESVLLQTYTNFEIIIIDDGSTDNIIEKLVKYSKNYKQVRYYTKPNRGQASAKNYGISKSRGEFILPLDADDKIE